MLDVFPGFQAAVIESLQLKSKYEKLDVEVGEIIAQVVAKAEGDLVRKVDSMKPYVGGSSFIVSRVVSV